MSSAEALQAAKKRLADLATAQCWRVAMEGQAPDPCACDCATCRLRRATERDIATLERHRPEVGHYVCFGCADGLPYPCAEVAPLIAEYLPEDTP